MNGAERPPLIDVSRAAWPYPLRRPPRQEPWLLIGGVAACSGQSMIHRVAERDGWTCRYCGVEVCCGCDPTKVVRVADGYAWFDIERPEADHVIPRSRGGVDHIRNRVLACPGCNNSKAALTPAEWFEVLAQRGEVAA